MCTPSRVLFFPLFSNAWYQKKTLFIADFQKGHFVSMSCFFRHSPVYIFSFGVYFSATLSKTVNEGKISKAGRKIHFLEGTSPYE